MGAKNWVLEGDYKHKAVIMQGGKAVLNVGLMKKSEAGQFHDRPDRSRGRRIPEKHGFRRGARCRWRLLLGPLGVVAAATAKTKGVHVVAVQFKDGKRSLLELDDTRFKGNQTRDVLKTKKRPGVRPLGVFLFEILHVATLLQFLFEAALKARVLGALRGVGSARSRV